MFQPPDGLNNKQMLAQYSAALSSTNQKIKTFEFLGCNVDRRELSAKTSSSQFSKLLKNAANNPNSIGIIVQNPIPKGKLKSKLETIPPRLDIDGINSTSIFEASATSEAVSRLVSSFAASGDRVAVVGSMGFVGGGVVKLLQSQGIGDKLRKN
ncbi:MAG: tetrahydrofolate dehydrogenase/cyclohydrolase catalytic domain-containing protein [Waterburya sp.]